MKISVSVNGLDALKASLGKQAKQIQFAMSKAINATAKKVVDAMPAEIGRAIDRPTTFTKNGVRILGRPATKNNLMVRVGFMDLQAKYMQLQIEGGTRQAGPHGIKLPGNITLNSFGNIPRGVIAQLKAAAKSGELSKTISRRLQVGGNRRKKAGNINLFLGKPAGKGWENAPYGIWRRIDGNPGRLVAVVLFSPMPAHYKKRFDFYGKSRAVVHKEWAVQFNAALVDALRSAR